MSDTDTKPHLVVVAPPRNTRYHRRMARPAHEPDEVPADEAPADGTPEEAVEETAEEAEVAPARRRASRG
jgi:hypothetical protein